MPTSSCSRSFSAVSRRSFSTRDRTSSANCSRRWETRVNVIAIPMFSSPWVKSSKRNTSVQAAYQNFEAIEKVREFLFLYFTF